MGIESLCVIRPPPLGKSHKQQRWQRQRQQQQWQHQRWHWSTSKAQQASCGKQGEKIINSFLLHVSCKSQKDTRQNRQVRMLWAYNTCHSSWLWSYLKACNAHQQGLYRGWFVNPGKQCLLQSFIWINTGCLCGLIVTSLCACQKYACSEMLMHM